MPPLLTLLPCKGTPRIIPASKGRHEDAFLKPWRQASPLYMLAVGASELEADGQVQWAVASQGLGKPEGWAGSTHGAPEPRGPVRAPQAEVPSSSKAWAPLGDWDRENKSERGPQSLLGLPGLWLGQAQ